MKNWIFLLVLAAFLSCENKPEIAKNRMKEDVTFLADDKLEGRQTGTKGEIAAAEFIAKRFKNIGLQPKGTCLLYTSDAADE